MLQRWYDMLGSLRPVVLTEAVGLAEGHSTDCNHLAATAARHCKGAVLVVAAAVVGGEEAEASHDWERS